MTRPPFCYRHLLFRGRWATGILMLWETPSCCWSMSCAPLPGTAEQLWDWGAWLNIGGGGGAKYTFSYELFIILKILGGGHMPPCPPYSAAPDFPNVHAVSTAIATEDPTQNVAILEGGKSMRWSSNSVVFAKVQCPVVWSGRSIQGCTDHVPPGSAVDATYGSHRVGSPNLPLLEQRQDHRRFDCRAARLCRCRTGRGGNHWRGESEVVVPTCGASSTLVSRSEAGSIGAAILCCSWASLRDRGVGGGGGGKGGTCPPIFLKL